MRTETKPVKYTYYICDNCGAEHKSENKFHVDYITGLEICDKCATPVGLANRDIYYDEYDKSCGEVYTKGVYVNKDTVKTSLFDLDLDKEDYCKRVAQIRQMYVELMDSLDKAYIEDRVRGWNLKGYNLDESSRW